MLAVTVIFNGTEWVAESGIFGITLRGLGHTPKHACKDLRVPTGVSRAALGQACRQTLTIFRKHDPERHSGLETLS
jgi:hypothetical protein